MPITELSITIEGVLDGILFAVAKVQIIKYAGEEKASDDAMELLRGLPVKNYYNMKEINAELGLIPEQSGSENVWS